MIGYAGAIALAAFFTLGCATIHELRTHAEKITVALIAAAVVLGAVTILAAVTPTAATNFEAPDPPAVYGFE